MRCVCGAEETERARRAIPLVAAAVVLLVAVAELARGPTPALAGLATKGKDPRVVRDGADARQAPRSRWLLLPPPPKPRRVTPPCEDHDAYREGPW